jgi:predicted MFS family arabinose efflux permease
MLAAAALLLGCVGQYLAGRFAKAERLERQLMLITFCNVPFLIWMAVATDWQRFVAAGSFCIVHFMHQPVYNSLIPKYAPARQRSLCFGISFAMAFGFGSFGASFAGATLNETFVYLTLGGFSFVAGLVALILMSINRSTA